MIRFGVEVYLGPNIITFVTAKGAQVYSVSLPWPLEGFCFGWNEIYLYNFMVGVNQNIISCTASQTAFVSAAWTLNTQRYSHAVWRQQDERW